MRAVAVMVVLLVAACVDEVETTSSAVVGTAIYIDAANLGTERDGTINSPYRTLAEAEPHLGQKATVILRGGTYPAMTFGQAWSGISETERIVVKSYPGETAVFDPGIDCFKTPTTCIPWESCAPNNPACKCAHAEVYTSTDMFSSNTRWGTMLDSDTRLLSYSRAEDLCSNNESDLVVPLSDPRPGFVIASDPTTKRLFAYRGPGLWWNPETQRIHVRLSATHLDGGAGNYTGPTNPNVVRMSIASEGTTAAVNNADHITFERIVFQNGGEELFLSDTQDIHDATDVVFDHCTFKGARRVIRLGSAKQHRFMHCTFSALLGPWVSREDVKLTYDRVLDPALAACQGRPNGTACSFTTPTSCGPSDCRVPPGSCVVPGACQTGVCVSQKANGQTGTCHIETIGACRTTAESLFVNNGNSVGLEIAFSEFRDGHDAIQTWGTDTNIHHSLFENINDGVFFADQKNVVNLRIHHNLIRKSLDVFVHDAARSDAPVTTGARYYYRNVIDKRVPVLGFHRRLVDDLPIWRVGVDFKMNLPIGELYAYHNTIVQANPNLGLLSFGTSDFDSMQPKPRQFVNNVHVTFDGDDPLYSMPPVGYPALATANTNANVWSRRKSVVTAPRYPGNAAPPPGWDTASQFRHPRFRNVPDYGLPVGAPFENTDYALHADDAACTAALDLSGLSWGGQRPPDDAPAGSLRSIGAIPCVAAGVASPPFVVGVDGRFSFPIAGRPVAEAGDYATVNDGNGDGFETVAFSAAQSLNATTFSWRDGFTGPVVATTSAMSRELAIGAHQAYLTVTGASGHTATDMREVTVRDPLPFSNLVRDPGFEIVNGDSSWVLGTGASKVTSPTHFQHHALQIVASTTTQRQAWQDVPIVRGSTIAVAGWLRTSSSASPPARLVIEWLDAAGTVVGSSPQVGTAVGTSYVSRVGVFVAPEAALTARVKLLLDAGTGSALFDDLRLRVVDNMVSNGHFESGLAGWEAVAITVPTVSTNPSNARSVIAAAEIASNGAAQRRFRQLISSIDVAKTYRFSGWITTNLSADTSARIEIVWLSPTGGMINGGGPFTIGSRSLGTYGEATRDLTPPAGAGKVRIDLVVPSGASGTAWFDDVYLRAM